MTRRSKRSRKLNIIKVKTIQNGEINRQRCTFIERRSQQTKRTEPMKSRFTSDKIANGQKRTTATRITWIDHDDAKGAKNTALLQLNLETNGLHFHRFILGVTAQKGSSIGLQSRSQPSGRRTSGRASGRQGFDGKLERGIRGVGEMDGMAVANQPATRRVKASIQLRQFFEIFAATHQIRGPDLGQALDAHFRLFFVFGHCGEEAEDVFQRQCLRVFELLENAAHEFLLLFLESFRVVFFLAKWPCC